MNSRGFTLIEIMVSMLLTAIIVSAVFSIALSTRRAGTKADRRQLATHAEKATAAALRNYVTADSNVTLIAGPNTSNGNKWAIAISGIQDDYAGCSFDGSGNRVTGGAQSGVFALAAGSHCLVCTATVPGTDGPCFLPKELRVPPFNGYIQYDVTGSATTSTPQVVISVKWREP